MSRLRGYTFILLAAVCWGTLGPVARLAFNEGVTPVEVAFWRAAIAGVIFLTHSSFIGFLRIPKRHISAIVGFGLVGVALFYGSYQLAVSLGGASLAGVLLYTAPAWVAIIGRVWLNETFTPLKLGSILLAIMGVYTIVLDRNSDMNWTLWALIWGLIAGFSYALYYPFGKYFFSRYHPVSVFAVALPVGAAVLLAITRFTPKSPTAWFALIWIAFVSTYVAYLAYAYGLKYLEATRASIVATFEPIVTALVAHFWWGERFGFGGYLGGALILSGVLLSIVDQEHIPSEKRESPTDV